MTACQTSPNLTWKPHTIKKGSFERGFACFPAELCFLGLKDNSFYDMLLPFSMVTMDNGCVLLLAAAQRNWYEGRQNAPLVQAFSAISFDSGLHFSDPAQIPGAHCRPSGLVDLGGGELYFRCMQKEEGRLVCRNYYSRDYGRNWESRFLEAPPPLTGRPAWTEGDAWVDYDDTGHACTVWEALYDTSGGWPDAPTVSFLRTSKDGGLHFHYHSQPECWRRQETYCGTELTRAVGEASLTRAGNGWLIAALRTDIHPKYLQGLWDDSLCGLAVSISKDDGITWSTPQILYEAGRHHPSFVRLRDGRLVMTYVLRDDMVNGELRSYRRGCEAIVSEDNGLSWDTGSPWILDDFSFLQDRSCWFNGNTGHCCSTLAPDGTILTAYGNYACSGICLIKWHPGSPG